MPLVIRFNATAKYFIHTINSIRLLAFILNYKCICVNFFELRADDAISIKASSVLLFIVSSRANGIAHHIRIFFCHLVKWFFEYSFKNVYNFTNGVQCICSVDHFSVRQMSFLCFFFQL